MSKKLSIDHSILLMASSEAIQYNTVAGFIDAVIKVRNLKTTKTNRIAYHTKYAELFRSGHITRQGGCVRLTLKGRRLLELLAVSDGPM